MLIVNFTRAFRYVFEDRDWVNKAVIAALLAFATIFFPVGLIALAALLGYIVELARNVRSGSPTPLPQWVNYGDKINVGLNVLVAYIVYNIVNFLLTGCILTLTGAFQNSFLGIAILCCTVPLILIYNLVTWPMLALGTIRYSETGKSAEFYRFGDLFATLRANFSLTFQWVILSIFVNVVFGLLAIIPCLGWVAVLALSFPVQGHLLGQFAHQLDLIPPKAKRAPAG